MKRKITYIIIAVAAVALAALIISRCSHKNRKTETVYETEAVTIGSIGKIITATGTVEPISKVEVGTQVSGNIAKIYVDYNSVVKKGQLIAELDRTNLRSELSMQENSLASAENEMNYQKKNYERTKQLYEQHLVSDAEYEESEYRYKTSVYTYNRAKESVATARTNLGYSYIYSPIDGVILSKSVEEGQTVAASFSTPTLFTIANDLSKMQVVANVDEADIGQVEVGQPVSFTVDAFPDETFEGTVTQIRLEAQVSSNVVTYEVVIEAPNPDLKLMPGLTANISIYVLKIDDVLLLPAKALRYRPSSAPTTEGKKTDTPPAADKSMPAPPEGMPPMEGKSFDGKNMPSPEDFAGMDKNSSKTSDLNGSTQIVWVLENGKPQPKRITLGANDGIHYQVTEGLKQGDKVVVGESASAGTATEASSDNNAKQSPFMPGPPGSKKK